jgi:PadR family transcriptional regulator, regulatory protein AphA
MLYVDSIRLTPTSYVVLGLVAQGGRVTSYDLKREAAARIGYVWNFPHAQLYTEPARLVAAGLLQEQREQSGRNRRHYTITAAGRAALRGWISRPTRESMELRDPGLLRLLFADLVDAGSASSLARDQEQVHRKRLATLKEKAERESLDDSSSLASEPLRLGLLYERLAIRFWNDVGRKSKGSHKGGRAISSKSRRQ